MSQASLATAARVSRRWLSDLEAGKATAEIGLVFRTLDALRLVMDVRPDLPGPDDIDLDEVLRRHTAPHAMTTGQHPRGVQPVGPLPSNVAHCAAAHRDQRSSTGTERCHQGDDVSKARDAPFDTS